MLVLVFVFVFTFVFVKAVMTIIITEIVVAVRFEVIPVHGVLIQLLTQCLLSKLKYICGFVQHSTLQVIKDRSVSFHVVITSNNARHMI